MVGEDGEGGDGKKETQCWHEDYKDMLDKNRWANKITATAGLVAQRGCEIGGSVALAGYGLGRLHQAE